MNRVLTSSLALGLGVSMVAYMYARKTNIITDRQVKKLQKRVKKALP